MIDIKFILYYLQNLSSLDLFISKTKKLSNFSLKKDYKSEIKGSPPNRSFLLRSIMCSII